ncbi:unnamed protein product, partial [marine sediment metagenome]
MADYPSHDILLGSTQDLESGWDDSIATSGWHSNIEMHGKQY